MLRRSSASATPPRRRAPDLPRRPTHQLFDSAAFEYVDPAELWDAAAGAGNAARAIGRVRAVRATHWGPPPALARLCRKSSAAWSCRASPPPARRCGPPRGGGRAASGTKRSCARQPTRPRRRGQAVSGKATGWSSQAPFPPLSLPASRDVQRVVTGPPTHRTTLGGGAVGPVRVGAQPAGPPNSPGGGGGAWGARTSSTFWGGFRRVKTRGECGAWGQRSGETPGPRGWNASRGTPDAVTSAPPSSRGAPHSPPAVHPPETLHSKTELPRER